MDSEEDRIAEKATELLQKAADPESTESWPSAPYVSDLRDIARACAEACLADEDEIAKADIEP